MDHFELYGLPLTFHPDGAEVKKQFYALSKKYHPDFYINESAEKQEEVLSLSTLNNKAYNVLKDPQKVLHYVLQLRGMLPDGENYPLPQDFLMEMMEVNEELMELEFSDDLGACDQITDKVKAIERALNEELTTLTTGFDSLEESEQDAALLKIKDFYYRNKYLLRIHVSLQRLKSKDL